MTAESFWEYSPMRSIRMWRCRSILETNFSCLRMGSQRPQTLAVKNTVSTDYDRNLMGMQAERLSRQSLHKGRPTTLQLRVRSVYFQVVELLFCYFRNAFTS